jgi:hypothetical protein
VATNDLNNLNLICPIALECNCLIAKATGIKKLKQHSPMIVFVVYIVIEGLFIVSVLTTIDSIEMAKTQKEYLNIYIPWTNLLQD